jgi:hypothetical protein
MTKYEFNKMFCYTRLLVARSEEIFFDMQPSAHLINHCGGYELELHPKYLMWDKEIALLSLIAERLALSLECHFSDGSIIIR